MQDLLALREIDVVLAAGFVERFDADGLLRFKFLRDVRVGFYQAAFVSELEVGEVLLDWRDPAVADEKAFDVPFVGCSGRVVAVEDRLRDVGDVLASVGLAGEVDLSLHQLRA